MKFTGQLTAYITNDWTGPQDIHAKVDAGNPNAAVMLLGFSAADTMSGFGWVPVGTATITVEMIDNDTIVNNKVAALRSQVQKVRADAEVEAMRLQEQIEKLLAITYVEAA